VTVLAFSTSDTTGRFAVISNGHIVFESYHLDAAERSKLREVMRELDERAWSEGHDAAVSLTKEFVSALHLVKADR
jgi:hypothetical protein